METNEQSSEHMSGKKYTFFVDGKEFETSEASLTCGEIMDLAGIARNVGLIEVLDGGAERKCPENDVFTFDGPGRRFKKAPRFKRG